MKKVCKFVAAAAVLALAFGATSALASTPATATLPVQASVTSGCLVVATPINFGAVSPLIVEEDVTTGLPQSTGSVVLACGTNGPTAGSVISIALDTGANGAIAPIIGIGTAWQAIRAMTNGTSFLAYDLYQPTTDTEAGTIAGQSTCEWGNGGGGTTITGPGSLPCNTGFINPGPGGAGSLIITSNGYADCIGPAGDGVAYCAATVYGVIPGDQEQPLTPGIYVDTVNVSVSF